MYYIMQNDFLPKLELHRAFHKFVNIAKQFLLRLQSCVLPAYTAYMNNSCYFVLQTHFKNI